MKTYGLEMEMFLLDENNKPVVIPKYIPYDECGLLVEARGKPSENIYEAVYSLISEYERINDMVTLRYAYPKYHLSNNPCLKVDRKTKVLANRTYSKGVLSYRNYCGYEHHRNSINEVTAGIHLSVTNKERVCVGDKTIEYNAMFDWIRLFQHLDKSFAEEIKDAKRNPGFYEIKVDGRIEYRSLPSDIDLKKLIKVIYNFIY